MELERRRPPTPTDPDSRDNADRPSQGFVAQLDGVSLWDLVQMECLAGGRKAVRVRSGTQLGYLFFDAGQLVHAVQGTRVGDEAARAVLGWDCGEVAPCELRWPRMHTVETPWQTLLMAAAQRQDETRRASAQSQVVPIDAGRRDGTPEPDSKLRVIDGELPAAAAQGTEPDTTGATVRASHDALDASADAAEVVEVDVEVDVQTQEQTPTGAGEAEDTFGSIPYACAIRLDGEGELLAAVEDVPGAAEALAGQAAYGLRIADLLGELLSLGPAMAVEARVPSAGGVATAVFTYRDREGGTVALQPAHAADAAQLRRELGL